MSDYGFNIPPKKRIVIGVTVLAYVALRQVTDGLLVELLTWAFIIAGLTAIWNWKPD